MFFHLPREIIHYIYLFDSTYHEIYKNVLKDIIPYQVFYRDNYILILKKDESIAHSTNCLENPSYICTHYLQNYNNMKQIIDTNHLKPTKELNSLILSFIDNFDLDNFPFEVP